MSNQPQPVGSQSDGSPISVGSLPLRGPAAQQEPEQTKAPLRLAVLVSGSGSNLQALIDAIEGARLPGVEIALVISSRAEAYGLRRALSHKLPAIHLPWTRRSQQAEAEAKIVTLLELFQIDLIVLAGWMRIFSPAFIMRYPQRMINLHPSLLPSDGGESYITSSGEPIPALRGLHVVERALQE